MLNETFNSSEPVFLCLGTRYLNQLKKLASKLAKFNVVLCVM